LIERGGGIAAATAVAGWWLEQAVRALAVLPATSAVAALIALAHASVTRGLRPGQPSFMMPPPGSRATFGPKDSLVDARGVTPGCAEARIELHLTRLLEWFHPGLSAMVSARAQDPLVRSRRARLQHTLLQDDRWSPGAMIAADAIALAGAMAAEPALQADPVRTLALVDALHCAAIGLLNDETDPQEHEEMAARVRDLRPLQPSPIAAFIPQTTRTNLQPTASLNA
jgi:hypothetical protein